MSTRREHDLLGDRDVPADAYYGVHTLRAVENFPISGTPISIYPDLIAALASIKQRAATAEAQGSQPPRPIASLSDPEARVMPDKQGKSKPGYNAQIAVDSKHKLIAAFELTNEGNDERQHHPMAVEAKEALEAAQVRILGAVLHSRRSV